MQRTERSCWRKCEAQLSRISKVGVRSGPLRLHLGERRGGVGKRGAWEAVRLIGLPCWRFPFSQWRSHTLEGCLTPAFEAPSKGDGMGPPPSLYHTLAVL